MADVTLSKYAFFSLGHFPDWDWSRTTGSDSGLVYVNNSQQKIVLAGTFNPTGDFSISGKVTEMSFLDHGNEVCRITGLDLDAATLANLIDNGTDSRKAFAYILAGNDTIKGGAGNDYLYGYGGDDTILAGDGDDEIVGGPGNDMIDGGKGVDTVVYSGKIADYKIERTATGISVTDLKGDGGTDNLKNVEMLRFDDKMFLTVDPHGLSGQLFRLYQAALDRAPDALGMGYWENQLDVGNKLENLASHFITSPEFKKLYGSAHSNAELVSAFYQHILHRPGEKAGIDFWTGVLDSHAATTAQVLVAISDSPENVQLSIGLIGNGVVADLPVVTV